MKQLHAVCSVCQRLIHGGLQQVIGLDVVNSTLTQHPAADVFIDVSKPNWWFEFDPSKHNVCEGSGQLPECVLPVDETL